MKERKRLYKIGPCVEYMMPEKCCVFCKHCVDVVWDYKIGPYLCYCENDYPAGDYKTCGEFEGKEEK